MKNPIFALNGLYSGGRGPYGDDRAQKNDSACWTGPRCVRAACLHGRRRAPRASPPRCRARRCRPRRDLARCAPRRHDWLRPAARPARLLAAAPIRPSGRGSPRSLHRWERQGGELRRPARGPRSLGPDVSTGDFDAFGAASAATSRCAACGPSGADAGRRSAAPGLPGETAGPSRPAPRQSDAAASSASRVRERAERHEPGSAQAPAASASSTASAAKEGLTLDAGGTDSPFCPAACPLAPSRLLAAGSARPSRRPGTVDPDDRTEPDAAGCERRASRRRTAYARLRQRQAALAGAGSRTPGRAELRRRARPPLDAANRRDAPEVPRAGDVFRRREPGRPAPRRPA